MELSFLIKKLLTFFIEPYGLFLFLLFLGIWFLYRKEEYITKNILIFLFSLMVLLAYPPFSNLLVSSLENDFISYDYREKDIKYIHVLGSGHTDDANQPVSSLINSSGIKRVIEGVLIHKKYLSSKLVFTGYKGNTSVSNAKLHSMLAEKLGVKKENIIINDKPKDTAAEVEFMKELVKEDEFFVLVTSATHMKRALGLYKEVGLKPLPAPTDFHKNKTNTFWQLPSISALKESQIAIHEYLGIFWNKIKG